MKSLRELRAGWDTIQAEETKLLRSMTAVESIRIYLDLQSEFEQLLRGTEPVFRRLRNESLIQLQSRLQKLNEKNTKAMKNLVASLVKLQERLEQAGIPSILIGGLAVSQWGQPRLTHVVDIKALINRSERARLLELLARYTPLNANPDEALRRNGVAFFQDPEGTRIDILLAETSFDETAIGRALAVELEPGQMARICTAEDLIVYKMVS